MAKKKKKQKPKQGHPARLQEGVVSMDRVKVGRGLDALTPKFVQWYAEYRDDPELALMVLAAVRETLGVYAEVVGLNKVTDFDPPKLLAVLNSMIEFEEAENPEAASNELGTMIYMAWADYAQFLRDTNLWQRELGGLDWFQKSLDVQDPFAGEPNAAAGDELDEILDSEEASMAAMVEITAMPISKLGRALLSWVLGEGSSLWASAPTDEFIETAAKAVEKDLPAGLEEPRKHQVVALVLQALDAANAVTLNVQAAPERGLRCQDMLEPEDADSFDVNFYFIQACLDLLLEQPAEKDQTALEAWGLAAFWILEATDGNPQLAAAPRDEQWSSEVWETAQKRMQELRILGLLESGEAYSLPNIVRLAVIDVDEDIFEEDDELDDEKLDAIFGPDDDEPKRLKRETPYTGEVLQLKLTLKDSKPPIWRRVLVPMDLNLGDLHDIIQASFDWYDGHLHSFYEGGFGGTTYGPAIEEMDYQKNEAETLVSSVLKKEKDRLDYLYDFGDSWEVRIDVEKVLDADGGQLPRCTGGRRMAPLEDSGGIGGWEAKLEILNDPNDPEYEEVADWCESFGLDEGEQIDPASFSKEEINANLDIEF